MKKISIDITDEQFQYLEAKRRKYGVSIALQIRIALEERIDKLKQEELKK